MQGMPSWIFHGRREFIIVQGLPSRMEPEVEGLPAQSVLMERTQTVPKIRPITACPKNTWSENIWNVTHCKECRLGFFVMTSGTGRRLLSGEYSKERIDMFRLPERVLSKRQQLNLLQSCPAGFSQSNLVVRMRNVSRTFESIRLIVSNAPGNLERA